MELTPVPQEMQLRQAYENRGIFYLDHLGSVISLWDSHGEVTWYTYDAFGNVTGQLGNAPNELKFTGAPMDSNGLVHLGARFYKPSVGRFITAGYIQGFALDALDSEPVCLRWQQPGQLHGSDRPLFRGCMSGLGCVGET